MAQCSQGENTGFYLEMAGGSPASYSTGLCLPLRKWTLVDHTLQPQHFQPLPAHLILEKFCSSPTQGLHSPTFTVELLVLP